MKWLGALVVATVLAVGCRREAAPVPVVPLPLTPALPALPALPVAAAPSPTSAEVESGLGSQGERRKPRPAIIGGCAESCASPELAVSFFMTQLQHQERLSALRPLFEWSLLEVDGEALGPRWANLWSDPLQHAERDHQIDQWLLTWSAWIDRVDDPTGFGRARATGIRLQRPQGVSDRVVVTFRHPHMRNDTSDPSWRIEWTLRGYEWLVSRIDHRPASAPR